MSWPAVRAPGKVFLAGEYGVLSGGVALVAAVDRYAVVTGGQPQPGNALETELLRRCHGHFGADRLPPGSPVLDTGAFMGPSGHKLGLGSSAASAAALTGACVFAAGGDPSSPGGRHTVLELAWRGHRAAGGGSGADVAASVLGGVVSFRAPADEAGLPQAERVEVAPERLPIVVHGGAPLSSRAALATLDEHRDRLAPLLADATAVGDALSAALASEADPIPEIRAADALLRRLGEALDLGAGLGGEVLDLADRIARRYGGAVKSSGAGGGDLVLVFAPALAPADRAGLVRQLTEVRLYVLDLKLDTSGVTAPHRGEGHAAPRSYTESP